MTHDASATSLGPAELGAPSIDHVGIAVRSIEAQRPFYERVLGARFEGVEDVPEQRVRVAFYALGDPAAPIHLELLEPTTPDSPISSFLEKRGEGVHHIAYRVQGLAARLIALKAAGVRLIDERPRMGARGALVAFLHPKSTNSILTELCEHAQA